MEFRDRPADAGLSGIPEVVWAFRTAVPMEEMDLHVAELDEHGVLGLTEEHGRTTAWFPSKIAGLGLVGTWEPVPAAGWDDTWRARLEPVTAGPFVVTPPWKATGAAGEIIIEPAQAFGTGHHETTTGCLHQLARCDLRGRSVLDVGTGTGILGIAAARLGAGRVVACDTDEIAVATARDNARINNVAETVMSVRVGSLDAVPAGVFDVVVANLNTTVIVELAAQLVARCSGNLVVSGVSRERVDEAVSALREAAVDPCVHVGREWAVLTGYCA